MIARMASTISRHLVTRQVVPEDYEEVYAFGFECVLSTAIQVVILLIIGIASGLILETAFFFGGFVMIKKYIGGWHAESHFACITAFSCCSLSLLPVVFLLPAHAGFALAAAALALIWRLAPISHYNNPKSHEENLAARKVALRMAAAEALVIAILLLAAPTAGYGLCAAYGLFLASFSLLVPNRKEVQV